MELFDLAEGAVVRNAAGDSLGRIDRFVIDPSTSTVTHLVVEKGIFFHEDRVVPIGIIGDIAEDEVTLTDDVGPDDLPRYEQQHFVQVDDATRSGMDHRLGEAAIWRFPTMAGATYGFPEYPVGVPAGYSVETERNVPDDSIVVEAGTPVRTRAGEDIGKVSDVVVDRAGGINHLVVDLGFLEDERILPAHWIDSYGEEQVTVAVGRHALEGLPPRT